MWPWVKTQIVAPVNIPILSKIDYNGWRTYPKMVPLVLNHGHVSHNQNPVLQWSTQNHAARINKADIRNYFWLGLPLTNLHLPGFDFVSCWQSWVGGSERFSRYFPRYDVGGLKTIVILVATLSRTVRLSIGVCLHGFTVRTIAERRSPEKPPWVKGLIGTDLEKGDSWIQRKRPETSKRPWNFHPNLWPNCTPEKSG